MNIHHFDDTEHLRPKISTSSWFYRFTLTWKGSLEPIPGSYAILEVIFNPISINMNSYPFFLGYKSPLYM